MYKNYKIDKSGDLKYSPNFYRVDPERRFNKNTEKWEKRLKNDNTVRFNRRRKRNTNTSIHSKFDIKYIFYILCIILVLSIWTNSSSVEKSNDGTTLTSSPSMEFSIKEVSTNLGDKNLKPSKNYSFININMELNNNYSDNKTIKKVALK